LSQFSGVFESENEISNYLNQKLNYIIENKHEKMLQNFEEFIKLSTTKKWNGNGQYLIKSDEFFIRLEPHLKISNKIDYGSIYILEVDNLFHFFFDNFSILYLRQIKVLTILIKTMKVQMIHLIYFLELFNIYRLKNDFTNKDTQFNFIKIKDKCFNLIKNIVKNLNYTNRPSSSKYEIKI
jgi:hypothetical protein